MTSAPDPRMPDIGPAAREAAFEEQRTVGLTLAGMIVGAWAYLHLSLVFVVDAAQMPLIVMILLVALQTWLSVGLFIVAHDAMHGSLAPFRPDLNRMVGRVALALFAVLDFDSLAMRHFAHHRHAGTADDPDFDADHPRSFWPWFGRFMLTHVGWRDLVRQTAFVMVYLFVLGVALPNLLIFWALPAVLATLQLFYFGTYRPHRHEGEGHGEEFADRHRARSEHFPGWLSLMTCFHFGHHHEHHVAPHVPWWMLPAYRRRAGGRDASGPS